VTLTLGALIVLAAGAVAALAASNRAGIGLAIGLVATSIAGVLCAVAGLTVLLGAESGPVVIAWPLPLGTARLGLDGLSAWFLMVIGVVTLPVSIYSWGYLSGGHGHGSVRAFAPLMCVMIAAMILVVAAADAVMFLVGWELMSLSAFFLVCSHDENAETRRGAWMYLVATHIGTALCVLPMFGVLVAGAGSTDFAAFFSGTGSSAPSTIVTIFVLGLLGFGTKAGFMPMHVWLPAAHPVAPTPVSAMLSGVVVKMGIYGLLRLLMWLPPVPAACGYLLFLIAVVSGVMGVLYALAQHDLKRLLAYHTVENIGIIALGISVGMLGQSKGHPALAVLGYAGALLHVANHALFKGLLFLSAGAVLHGTGTTELERLGGLAKRTPVNAGLFLIGAVAICGLPPLNGFVSEWVIYGSLFGGAIHGVGGSGIASAIGLAALALMGGLALACFAKVFGVVFLGEPRDAHVQARPTPLLMKIGMAGLALACVFIGVIPGAWLPLAQLPTSQLARSVPVASVVPTIGRVLAPAVTLSLLAAILALLVWGLVLIRRRMLSGATARDRAEPANRATWGCGYAQPTARMQYSASSFAASLVASFRTLLWPERVVAAPTGSFPTVGHLETHAPDIAERDLFDPLFRLLTRLFSMVRTVSWSGTGSVERSIDSPRSPTIAARNERRGPVRTVITGLVAALRRGSIQVHLAFIVITLVLLFLIEALSSPPVVRPPAALDSGTTISAKVQP